jgi:hypothetical protein
MAGKAVSVDRYRLVGTFERLRKKLVDMPDDGRLDRQLSYWVLPTDRRLPLAFLDRTLRELLDEPFDMLISTQGVGQKKILGFFELLQRASKATAADLPFGFEGPNRRRANSVAKQSVGFDPTIVSEQLWQKWCDAVRHGGFAPRKLGELAPTLSRLPTVIWNTPLGDYTNLSLAEIRSRKTHGEKRVRAILEVFCTVYEATATAQPGENLAVDLVPAFVRPATAWLMATLPSDKKLSVAEIRKHLAQPLVDQIAVDLDAEIARLATERLELDGPAPPVREQSSRLGVTRARVYQLLEDCSRVMEVRWPEGRWLIAPLVGKSRQLKSHDSASLLQGVLDLFYPPVACYTAFDLRDVELKAVEPQAD